MGALLADAASLGLHWIYDPERIAEVCENKSACFVPVDRKNYRGVKAVFVHQQRKQGALSQYGECLLIAIKNMGHRGELDIASYQRQFTAVFGSGGSYSGYIDAPTKNALLNIANKISPSGTEDNQHPTITRLPALVAVMTDIDASEDAIKNAIEITNLGEDALYYGRTFSKVLFRVLAGATIEDAMKETVDELIAGDRKALLADALDTLEFDSVAYGQKTGLTCHLPEGLPLCFHILRHADDYRHAIELNILAGGDSCGRGIIIGSILGASIGAQQLPADLLLQIDDGHALWQACETLVKITN